MLSIVNRACDGSRCLAWCCLVDVFRYMKPYRINEEKFEVWVIVMLRSPYHLTFGDLLTNVCFTYSILCGVTVREHLDQSQQQFDT